MAPLVLYAAATEPPELLAELARLAAVEIEFATHTDLLRRLQARPVQLVISDCDQMPEELYRDIRGVRATSQAPILALVPDPRTGAEALELGADMIAPKPVRLEETTFRIAVLLRRAEGSIAVHIYRDSQLELDRLRARVVVRGREVALTPTELRMLETLIARRDAVLRPEELGEAIWGDGSRDRAEVKLYISYLQRKFAQVDLDPIETVRGVGYRYAPRPRVDAVWSEAGPGFD
jgi:two-component system response regulator MtrA